MEFNLRRFIFFITGLLFLSCNNDEDIDPLKTTDLSISIEAGSATPAIGTRLVFTLTATNDGPLDATEVVVKNKIPSGYTFDSFDATSGDYDSSTGLWTIGELKNQETVTINIVVIVKSTGDYKNTSNISGRETDLVKSNNSTSIIFTPITVTDDMLFTYTISEGNDKFVAITGLSQVWEDLSGTNKFDLKIPGLIQGYPVKVIGENAFYQKQEIVSVSLPNTIISIGQYAFYSCKGLTTVTLPNSITTIEDSAFSSCTGLTKINIPDKVKKIDWYTFSRCSSLIDVTISNSVEIIDYGAFEGCSSLTNISIPANVNQIGDGAFEECLALSSLSVDASNKFFIVDDNVLFNKEYDYLLFCLPTKSGTYTIPNSVTKINWAAFRGCKKITHINIPTSVVTISPWVFYGCESLSEIEIPVSVKEIGALSFNNVSNLQNVIVNAIIPPSTSASWKLFANCPKLISIRVPAGSLESYKNAVGWSEYKNIISAQ